ncbi:MAG: methyltransferase domain-containing protein [Candidatus Helarchaeota archaeon]
MKNKYKYIKNLYLTDDYIRKNPSLHKEDSLWKVSKIIPLIDRFIYYNNKNIINLLDVGGGSGIILKTISTYINEKFNIMINKFALDLSPMMLEIQQKNNPDLKKILNENICKTSFNKKEIDLILMIDVLEHIPNPIESLKELKRIAKFIIFKVPLEDCLDYKIRNFIKRGKVRKSRIEKVGHINIYNINKLKNQIEKYLGHILYFYYTNVFEYFHKSEYYKNKLKIRNKLTNSIARYIFKKSPKLCSLLFYDFVMILVKCY